MMFEIVKYSPNHLAALRLQHAQSVLGPFLKDASFGAALSTGDAWSGLLDKRPVAIAGIMPKWEGSGTAWALFSEALPMSAWLGIVRMARLVIRDSKFWRIETTVKEDFPEGHRFAECVGFFPGEVMRKWGPDGMDYRMYEVVR